MCMFSCFFNQFIVFLITLGQKILYVGIKLIICAYVNVLKTHKENVFFTALTKHKNDFGLTLRCNM